MAGDMSGELVTTLPDLLRSTADWLEDRLAPFREVGFEDEEAFNAYCAAREDGGELVFTLAVVELALLQSFTIKINTMGTASSRLTNPQSMAKAMVDYYRFLWNSCPKATLKVFGLDEGTLDLDSIRLMATGKFGGIVNPFEK